jgi:hypothetical protein
MASISGDFSCLTPVHEEVNYIVMTLFSFHVLGKEQVCIYESMFYVILMSAVSMLQNLKDC